MEITIKIVDFRHFKAYFTQIMGNEELFSFYIYGFQTVNSTFTFILSRHHSPSTEYLVDS